MPVKLSKLSSILLETFPQKWASEWDNVGLVIGSPESDVDKILIALELTSQVLDEAIKSRVQAIITHHPPYLKPPQKLISTKPTGELIFKLIKNDIGMIALHTNVDHSPIGTNFILGNELGIKKMKYLNPCFSHSENYKFCVYVPADYTEKIIEAINRGKGGVIGNYSHCTFRTDGVGTFVPMKDAKPFIGKSERFEEVKEVRLEAVVLSKNLSLLISEVIKSHPYEEPAFDIYPLHQTSAKYGLGVIGKIEEDITLGKFIDRIKKVLGLNHVGVAVDKNKLNTKIKKAAICTGAGGEFIRTLSPSDADIFITGEARYHDLLEASEKGLNVIIGGHYATEVFFVKVIEKELKKQKLIKENKVKITVSKKMADPIYYI